MSRVTETMLSLGQSPSKRISGGTVEQRDVSTPQVTEVINEVIKAVSLERPTMEDDEVL